MLATVCLISVALAPAQPVGGSDWLLVPHWSRGQELVYQGSYKEEALGKGVQFSRAYQLQLRVFVLEKGPQGGEFALLTALKQRRRTAVRDDDATAEPSSVRLDFARTVATGRLTNPSGGPLLVPLQGPPTVECGSFLEFPNRRLAVGQKWEVTEEGRPPRTWTIAGLESVNGTSCLKLTGVQQSEDWDHPRADRTAWRRLDVVWLAPRFCIAQRVERTLEQREPARTETTSRTITHYELDNTLVYPNQLFEDRYREIVQARSFAETAEPLLREPGRLGPKPFEALLAKIAYHLDNRAATPYREAIVQLQRRLEYARTTPNQPVKVAENSTRSLVATVGQPAPDFVVPGLTGHPSVRLHRLLGKPILLVFYNPTSQTAGELLRFAQTVQDRFPSVTVVGMPVTDDSNGVLRQYKDLDLHFTLVSGKGLRQSYAVEATPKLVVLDAEGLVRGAYEGWGREIPQAVVQELDRWLKK